MECGRADGESGTFHAPRAGRVAERAPVHRVPSVLQRARRPGPLQPPPPARAPAPCAFLGRPGAAGGGPRARLGLRPHGRENRAPSGRGEALLEQHPQTAVTRGRGLFLAAAGRRRSARAGGGTRLARGRGKEARPPGLVRGGAGCRGRRLPERVGAAELGEPGAAPEPRGGGAGSLCGQRGRLALREAGLELGGQSGNPGCGAREAGKLVSQLGSWCPGWMRLHPSALPPYLRSFNANLLGASVLL